MSIRYHIPLYVIHFNLSNQLTVHKLNFTITTATTKKFSTKTNAEEAAKKKI